MSTCLKGGYGTLHPLMRKTEPDFSQATFSASALFVWAGAVASLQWCLYAAACVRYECLKGGLIQVHCWSASYQEQHETVYGTLTFRASDSRHSLVNHSVTKFDQGP